MLSELSIISTYTHTHTQIYNQKKCYKFIHQKHNIFLNGGFPGDFYFIFLLFCALQISFMKKN